MPEIVFDIATKIVALDQGIWSVFPGLGKRFLELFLAEKVIFLDLPGIDLRPAILNNDELLRQHIVMSQAIANWHRIGGEVPPSRRAASYSYKPSASLSAAVGNVRNVFMRMKAGDLVVVAGRTIYEPVHIGEVQGPFDAERSINLRGYPRERIPVRSVRWLRVGLERRFLSQPLSQLLSNRKAIVSIDKDSFGDEIYRACYGDYVFGTDSRYVYRGPKYNRIAISTIPAMDLLSYFAAAFNAIEENEVKEFAALPIDEAIQKYFEQDILYSFEINFQSPGSFVLHAKRAVLPLFVATCVAATQGLISVTDARDAQVVNSAGPSVKQGGADPPDECVEIEEKFKAIMNAINADLFNQLCAKNKDAQGSLGLTVGVKQKGGKTK